MTDSITNKAMEYATSIIDNPSEHHDAVFSVAQDFSQGANWMLERVCEFLKQDLRKESQENAAKQFNAQIDVLKKEREELATQNRKMLLEVTELKTNQSQIDARIKVAEGRYKGAAIALGILLVAAVIVCVVMAL